jgi:hypothetical protein
MEQARHVFLAGNGLPGRWAGRDDFVIAETGFGLGNNFLATWAAWRADPQRCARLDFVSVELHPPGRLRPGAQPADVAAARVLKAVGRLAAPGATLATWSVASDMRAGLASAGFEVGLQRRHRRQARNHGGAFCTAPCARPLPRRRAVASARRRGGRRRPGRRGRRAGAGRLGLAGDRARTPCRAGAGSARATRRAVPRHASTPTTAATRGSVPCRRAAGAARIRAQAIAAARCQARPAACCAWKHAGRAAACGDARPAGPPGPACRLRAC